jgi:hypothetical protein
MSFSGKATYSAGSTLPEIAEDVADLVGILAPAETPLLDVLGDPLYAATSTRHEWIEDELLPNSDAINQAGLNDAGLNTTSLTVAHGDRFRAGDLIQAAGSREVLLVTAVATNTLTITRAYGGTTKSQLTHQAALVILGNAALEGADAGAPRFSTRARKSNFTQIFSAALQVSGSEAAVRQVHVADEMDYQKTLRLRELLRDLENTVINGVAPESTTEGSSTVRRTLRGILAGVTTNQLALNSGYIPADGLLAETHLNGALRTVWEVSGSKPDLIVCGGAQKRLINALILTTQRYSAGDERLKHLVNTYESDYGVCRIILSRYVPNDAVIFLDSTKIAVVPLAGRSFQYKDLAVTGDYVSGEIIGEYTLELRNEKSHAVLRGLST